MGFQRFTGIAAFIDRITDRQLLDASIKFLVKNSFALQNRPEWIAELSASGIYDDTDTVKIEARSNSLQITFIFYKKLNDVLNAEIAKLENAEGTDLTAIPSLLINVKNRTIADNSDEVNDL